MNEWFGESYSAVLAHYAALTPAAGFQGRCAMSIPVDIEGKRVLDVFCRKGKGAFALADAVGPSGYVVGVDPDAGNVAAACAAAPGNHRAGASWERCLRFSQAIPENLSLDRIGAEAFDLVYINSVLNLVWSLAASLAEFARVLAPGGRLWVAQGVFADDGLDTQGERAGMEDGAGMPSTGAPLGKDTDAPGVGASLANSDGRGPAMNRHMLFDSEPDQIDVFSQARSRAAFEEMCLEAGFSSIAFSSVSSIIGKDPRDGKCPGGARFCLADACATI